ncbi:acyl-CoA dehydrogenase [Mycobacterium sherrisii]|uniref:Acyl-CoA dehydrogenase n=2 Tax=Mycobacterium sherrisii TaxID=243061 RepID=A0A1E3SNU0_9MYCO|nr:acyl-CoA dehydrogenase [Mycobacterium sherrisii]
MSFMPGEDAESLREVVRQFLEKRSPETEVRRLMETTAGYDPVVWTQAAVELGLHGLVLPEHHGGGGASPVELGVVFEEMGSVLFCGPFLATVGLAATALLEIGDEQAQAAYLPDIAAGKTVATLAWSGDEPTASTLRASCDGNNWRVSGTADIVIDGASADLVLVAARTARGLTLFAVQGNDTNLTRTPLMTMDSTRKLTELTFDFTAATLIGSDGAATSAMRRTADLAALYLAAEQLGGATRVLATTVDYARTRVQFGRPIGSFQAIKHRCADMLVDVEAARSVVWHGLWTAVHDPARLSLSAALARSLASDAYQRVATDSLQIHGGIGFTWEHPAHLYLKRAKSTQLLLGSPARHRARLATQLGGDVSPRPIAAKPVLSANAGVVALQAEVDEFLAANPVPPTTDPLADRVFREARFDAGLAMVHFGVGYGGRGLDASLQSAVEERFADAGAVDHGARNVIGLGMALPTIHAHGTEMQRARFLRPGFSGEHIWCQLFSEPTAGSDLAALATRAVPDGDDFVVTGQKVWTSLGHVADWGILLARTDPDVPKHKGLTFFLLDMKSPGVEVRPLRQLTGEAEFNEVFLTEVRIPGANVLGTVGKGWQVAMTTLANERVALGGRPATRGSGPIGQAVATYQQAVAAGRVDPVLTDRLASLWARAEAARLTNVRAAAQVGRVPGPEGSIAKLQMAELNKAIYELCVDLSGSAGLLVDGYIDKAPDFASVHGGGDVRKAYLRSLANSIEGGTSEVLRNILGERVLGLPGEPRVDRDIPWKEVRRS